MLLLQSVRYERARRTCHCGTAPASDRPCAIHTMATTAAHANSYFNISSGSADNLDDYSW